MTPEMIENDTYLITSVLGCLKEVSDVDAVAVHWTQATYYDHITKASIAMRKYNWNMAGLNGRVIALRHIVTVTNKLEEKMRKAKDFRKPRRL